MSTHVFYLATKQGSPNNLSLWDLTKKMVSRLLFVLKPTDGASKIGLVCLAHIA